jgi:hypothetical protein
MAKHGEAQQSTVKHGKARWNMQNINFFSFARFVAAHDQSGGCSRVTNSKGNTTCLKVAGFSKVASPSKGLDETIGLMP